jgi:hypothetical protein
MIDRVEAVVKIAAHDVPVVGVASPRPRLQRLSGAISPGGPRHISGGRSRSLT